MLSQLDCTSLTSNTQLRLNVDLCNENRFSKSDVQSSITSNYFMYVAIYIVTFISIIITNVDMIFVILRIC